MSRSPLSKSLTERIVVSCISALAAAVTLFLYPVALIFIGEPAASGGTFQLGWAFYTLVCSKIGAFLVIGAAAAGFFAGAERMANIFSFFWGTHSIWQRFARFLEEQAGDFEAAKDGHIWLLVFLLVIFVAVVCTVMRYF